MDPRVSVLEDECLRRCLLGEDIILIRGAAIAVGAVELEALKAQFLAADEKVQAARVIWALRVANFATDGNDVMRSIQEHERAALNCLQESGEMSKEVKQLELGDFCGPDERTIILTDGPDCICRYPPPKWCGPSYHGTRKL